MAAMPNVNCSTINQWKGSTKLLRGMRRVEELLLKIVENQELMKSECFLRTQKDWTGT